MLRFAFSPNDDLHIGDLRIALFNYLAAQQRNEVFIVRVQEGESQEFLDLLGLFNIKYSQVIYQNQNFKFHSAMALQLLHEKRAFSCFCSPEWIQKKRQEAQETKQEYCYDDACRNLPAELVIDNTAPFTVRIVRPSETICVYDKIKGDVCFDIDTMDSFVILHQDKRPTEIFATAVEDMLSDISMVIRDEKYLKNTPKEIHIRRELGYKKEIEYAHLPAIENAQNVTVKYLLEEGYLPEAISNYLILISNKTKCKIFTLQEAKEWFTLDTIIDSSTQFDIDLLKEINKQHMKMMDATELSRYVGFADAEIGELAKLYIDEAVTTRELKTKITSIFEVRDAKTFDKERKSLQNATLKAPYFELYDDFKNYLLKETALEDINFERELRLLLTNSENGPDIKDIYKYLKNYIGEIIK